MTDYFLSLAPFRDLGPYSRSMKWFILLVALSCALVSLLNFVRAPDFMWAWKLAIITGEYGHWLVLLPLGLGLTGSFGATGTWRIVTLGLCAVAASGGKFAG